MKRPLFLLGLFLIPFLGAADNGGCGGTPADAERNQVNDQQRIYAADQPVPKYDYSLERDRVIGLYNARMAAAQTWSVWRSGTGVIEDWCPSSGYPLPYGVQLTAAEAWEGGGVVLPQAEPNGLFTNDLATEGTWVFCVVDGAISPVYVEDKVSVYPYEIKVDLDTNRVTRSGAAATVTLQK